MTKAFLRQHRNRVAKNTAEHCKGLERAYYEPSGTYEYYDSESDIYFNKFGQELRSETEYDVTEGYTPFGDE